MQIGVNRLQFDSLYYPYSSQRMNVYATKGMVATSQPLAAQAGLDVLKKGGNAMDAAIATAACLTVVEPTSNGIGGDAFALIWTNGELHGLNASGSAPQAISIKAIQEAGFSEMPRFGWAPVTVPGVPGAWAEISKRFGRLSLSEVVEPAIRYAREGFAISPILGHYWNKAYQMYSRELVGQEFEEWFKVFAPNGCAPQIGERWSSASHAKTLEEIAMTHAESFYRGELAEKIDHHSRKANGYLRKEDLASYRPEWVKPIKINYRGIDVWEIPPNGQGLLPNGVEYCKRRYFQRKRICRHLP